MSVTKKVIPNNFWGSNHNYEQVMQRGYASCPRAAHLSHLFATDVKHMIVSRRYETLSVHHILQQFRTSDCEWLMPQSAGMQGQSRVSVTDSLKRRELLEDFLFWFFDSFLIPLLRVSTSV